MRYVLAAATVSVPLWVVGTTMLVEPRWEGLIPLFIGGCLWWTALYLSRSAWQSKQAARRHGGYGSQP